MASLRHGDARAPLRARRGAAPRRARRGGRGAHAHRPVVRRGRGGPSRGGRRPGGALEPRLPDAPGLAPREAGRVRRRPGGGAGGGRDARGDRRAARGGRGDHLQDGRHVRGGVRGVHPVPLQHLRGRGRGPSLAARSRGDPRLGAQPDRPGDRVRLLLRARGDGLARPRLRDRHGQLQPRDRLDGLLDLGPALLRAPDPRGPRRGDRGRAGGLHRRRARRGRHRLARRPDPPQALPLDRPGPGARHAGRLDRPRRGPRAVLGGRAMEIVYDDAALARVMDNLTGVHGALAREGGVSATRPILIDRFLEDAVEVDVDAVRDADGDLYVAGVMEHVEEAGVHSGDSACALPPQSLSAAVRVTLGEHTRRIADALGVVGLINVQYAVKDEEVFVLEANPRASRTVPFVAKATGVAVAQVAVRVMVGASLASLRAEGVVPEVTPEPAYVSVKEAVLPFSRFPGVDTILGPEMRSTGEVMGIGESFGIAFAKAQLAAGTRLPDAGQVFLSLADRDKVAGLELARQLADLGFTLAATLGTAGFLRAHDVPVATLVGKVGGGEFGVDAVALIAAGDVQLVVNTPSGGEAHADGALIRTACVAHAVACITTLSAGVAAARGIADTREHGWRVRSLQELHR